MRTILLVAVVVWATLAAIWFLSLGPGPGAAVTPAATAPRTSVQAAAEPSEPEMGAGPQAETQASAEVSTPGQDVVVSTTPTSTQESSPSLEESAGGFVLQVGAFRSEESARTLLGRLQADGFPGFLQSARPQDPLYRVLIGPFPERSRAEDRQASLKARGIESFVKTLE